MAIVYGVPDAGGRDHEHFAAPGCRHDAVAAFWVKEQIRRPGLSVHHLHGGPASASRRRRRPRERPEDATERRHHRHGRFSVASHGKRVAVAFDRLNSFYRLKTVVGLCALTGIKWAHIGGVLVVTACKKIYLAEASEKSLMIAHSRWKARSARPCVFALAAATDCD